MAQPVLFPDGRFYNIENKDPEQIKRVWSRMEREAAERNAQQEESKGFLGRGIELLGSGVSELKGATAEGLQTLISPEAEDTALRTYAEQMREKARGIDPIKPIQEAEGFGDVVSSGLSYLAQSVPEMGTVMGSAWLGAKAGVAYAPMHPLAKLVGGLAGATIGGITPFLGRNTEEFREVKGRNPDRQESAALLATASVQSALNSVISTLAPWSKTTGADKVVGKSAGKVLRNLTTGSQNAFQNALKKGVQGTILEGSTEASQDILQILSANEFDTSVLNTDENIFRITEAMLAGAVIGGGIGLASSPFNREARTTDNNNDLLGATNALTTLREDVKLLPAPKTTKLTALGYDADAKPKGSPKAKAVLETEPEVEDLEVQNILKNTKLTGKQKADAIRLIFRQRAEQQNMKDAMAGNPEKGFEAIHKNEIKNDYNQNIESRIQEQINNTIRQDVVFARDDKGRETVSSMTVNDLIRSASGDSDQVVQNILKSTLPDHIKAKRIALHYNRTAKPRIRDLGRNQESVEPIFNKDGTRKIGPDGVPVSETKTYTSKLIRKAAKKLEKNYDNWNATAEQKIEEKFSSIFVDPETGEESYIQTDVREEKVKRTDPVQEDIMVEPEKAKKIGGHGGAIEEQRIAGARASVKTVDNIRQTDKAKIKPKINPDGTVNQEAEWTYEGALKYIEKRLTDLSARGKQGELLSRALRMQVINPTKKGLGGLDGKQIAGAFLAAEEIVNVLGTKGNVELEFLHRIAATKETAEASGATNEKFFKGLVKYGEKKYDASGKIVPLIQLAYESDVYYGGKTQRIKFTPEQMAQTAAHEAFHLLQDAYGASDPKAKSILAGAFNLEKGFNKLPSSIKRLLRRNSREAYDDFVKGDLKMSETELQAFVFENYKRAKQQGEEAPLSGVLGNYFNFISRFLPRFKNALQGAGFRTAEDIIETAAEGGAAETFARTPTPELIKEAEASAKEVRNETDNTEETGVVNQETSSRASVRIADPPVQTKKTPSYKLFRRLPNGDLTTLFVESTDVLGNENAPETGEGANKFIGADPDVFFFVPEFTAGYPKKGEAETKNTKGLKRVPTGKYDEEGKKGRTTGDSTLIPNQRVRQELIDRGYLPKNSNATRIDTVAYRPGMHAAKLPEADHIAYNDDNVWAEVEIPDDTSAEIQSELANFSPSERQLDRVPEGGYYTYTTNKASNKANEWIIAGSMKIKRVLTDQEVNEIRSKNGITPLEEGRFYKKDKGAERASIRMTNIDRLDINNPNKFPLNPALDNISQMFGLSPNERLLSGIDLLYPPTEIYTPTNVQEEKLSVKETGNALQDKAIKILGSPIVNTTDNKATPEQNESLARTFAALAYAIRQQQPKDSAIDWYTKSINEAIDAVATIHPEVKDPTKSDRAALSLAIAVTSQGVEVERNARVGLAIYEEWKETGRFPEYGEGKSKQAMIKNFQIANMVNDQLVKSNSKLRFYDLLKKKFTVKQLKDFFVEQGYTTTDAQARLRTNNKNAKAEISLTGENANSDVYGSYLLGPKIGNGFWQNLMGNFEPITMDMWFMRTWGRLTGTLVGKPSAFKNNLKSISEEIQSLKKGKKSIIGITGQDADFIRNIDLDVFKDSDKKQEMYDVIREVEFINQRWYAANKDKEGFDSKNRPQLFKSNSNAIVNGLSTIDSPRNGTDRKWMRDTVNRARKILKDQGLDLTSADFQALIWYPEKDLYRLLSEGKKETLRNISYKEAYERVIGDGKNYQSIRTNKKGELFSLVKPKGDKSSDKSTRKQDGRTIGVDSDIATDRASIRIVDGDVSSGMFRVMESPVDAQGLVPNDIQKVKFQVLKFLAPYNIFNKRVREAFVDQFVNGLEPIARRERAVRKKLMSLDPVARERLEKLPGGLLSYEEGAFKAIEMSQQMSARVQMMAEKGAMQMAADGSIVQAPNTKGLFEIFRPIGQGKDYLRFQMYVYARRSQRLLSEGREALLTQAEINEGLGYANDTFRQVFADYENFNKAMLKFMVDSGSITQAQASKLESTHDYIPFYRIQEEEVYEGGLFGQIKKPKKGVMGTSSAFDNPDSYIKKVMKPLKGGEQKIGDLYTNVFANAQAILSAGMKNIAMQKTVKLTEQAKQLGLYDDVPVKPRFIAKTDADFKNDNHFSYRENGVVKYYDVGNDQDLLTALRTFTPIQMQGILKLMQNMSRMFRQLITITPGFMIANFQRGDMAGVVTVDAKLTPMIDSIKGLRNVFNDAETAIEMKTIGGFGGYSFGEGSQNFANKMKRFYRRHEGYDIVDTPQKVADMMNGFLDQVNRVGETTELATREAIYRKLIENGVSKADAAYEALNLINFNRKGNPQSAAAQTLSILLPLVPFLNARIQGLYRTGAALGGTESNWKSTALKGATLMGMSLSLYAIMSQNDDWDKEPLHRKLNYYIIYTGDKKFLIPKPFEIGALFSTIPEVFLDGIKQRDGVYVRDAVQQILLNNFQFNPIPQAVSPLLEVATNRDFFRGRELESLGQRGLPTAQRAYSTTSQFAQIMGEATSKVGISPIEFEQLVNGYLGSMGALMLGGIDSFLSLTGAIPQRPAGLFGDSIFSASAERLGLTRFFKQQGMADPANRRLSLFYDLKREADQLFRGINKLREQGNYEEALELKKENRSLLSARNQLNQMFTKITDINDKIQGVDLNPVLNAKQKKDQRQQLIIRRNRIADNSKNIKDRIRKSA